VHLVGFYYKNDQGRSTHFGVMTTVYSPVTLKNVLFLIFSGNHSLVTDNLNATALCTGMHLDLKTRVKQSPCCRACQVCLDSVTVRGELKLVVCSY